MSEENISRRQFLKETGAGAIGVGVALPLMLSAQSIDYNNVPAVDKKQLVAALGDTIIPTAQGYPGYKRLESYGITDEVLKGLQGILNQRDLDIFNAAAGEVFSGRSFVNLKEDERTQFVEQVVATFPPDTFGVADFSALTHQRDELAKEEGALEAVGKGTLAAKLAPAVIQTLQKVFRSTRTVAFRVFYLNFPENRIARDTKKIPILQPGDEHQIINPNTKGLVTGWDVANYPGPVSWEEEEALRAKWMKIHWHKD